MRLNAFAPAKFNLFLHVGAADPSSGLHPVSSLMVFADLGDRAVLPPYVHHSPFGHTQPAVPVLGRGLVMDGTPCYSEPCAVAVAQPLVYVLLRVATLLHELLSVHASVEIAYSATVAARAVFNGSDVRRLIAAGPDGSRAPEKLCGYRRDCGRGEGTLPPSCLPGFSHL